jgi:[protein-PII] uridylyltransferase
VRQTCERTGDGTAAIRRRSAVVDRILIEMWHRVFAGQPALNISLLALGGYGRKDLFPYSDIDVLFALPMKRPRLTPKMPSRPSSRACGT